MGRRDNRRRLADGGGGKSPGGRRTTPGEDVGRWRYKESSEAKLNYTAGGAVGGGGNSMIQKATDTGGADRVDKGWSQ